jgi:hypothetical protein
MGFMRNIYICVTINWTRNYKKTCYAQTQSKYGVIMNPPQASIAISMKSIYDNRGIIIKT